MPTLIDFDADANEKNSFRGFTSWVRWEDRAGLKDQWGYSIDEYGGVYLLAHFSESPPTGPADYLDPAVVHVGEGAWFRGRWRQFERSAFRALSPHSGGHSYRAEFGSTTPPPRLFVAALLVWFGGNVRRSLENWTAAYRLHVERRSIWDITVHREGEHGLLDKK